MNGYELMKLAMLLIVLEASHKHVYLYEVHTNSVIIKADDQEYMLDRVFLGHSEKTVEDLLPLMEAI